MQIVYGLEDPRDHLYHYIGITDDVYRRFQDHITGSAGNIKKNGWIWECRQVNIMISMREIERIELLAKAEEREKYWIWHYLQLGHPLHNTHYAQSIQEEIAALERQYRGLITKKSHLVQQIHRAEEELARVNGSPLGVLSNADTSKIVELHKQGFTLRSIVKATGWKYYRVQKLISEQSLYEESVIAE